MKVGRPTSTAASVRSHVKDPATNRALASTAAAVETLQRAPVMRVLDATLVTGSNRVRHVLGRRPVAVQVQPHALDANLRWACDLATATKLELTIEATTSATLPVTLLIW